MTKIIVFTPIWHRHDILEIWYEGIKRLQALNIFEIIPFLMVSNHADEAWAMNHVEHYCVVPNDPLGRKQNMGLKMLEDVEFDYICQISSDLLLTDNGLRSFEQPIKEGHQVIGFDRALFIEGETKDTIEFHINTKTHNLLGAGRLIGREVIEKLDFALWDGELNRNLDGSSRKRMDAVYDKKPYVIHDYGMVGIKSDIQITPFTSLKMRSKSADVDLHDYLSDKEVELINEL